MAVLKIKDANGDWQNVIAIKGDKGEPGEQGPIGPSGNTHAVGEEWVSYVGQIPVGGVPYGGQEVNRETYADLWEYAQSHGLVISEDEWNIFAQTTNGNVPHYSTGNGSTTFRMPKIVGYVKGTSTLSEVGGYIKEGLPNITGGFRSVDLGGNEASVGAFWDDVSFSSEFVTGGVSTGFDETISFDASRSSTIYGNSAHVTPETSVVMFGVYAHGEIIANGELDAETLSVGLATVELGIENVKTELQSTIRKNSEGHLVMPNGAEFWIS